MTKRAPSLEKIQTLKTFYEECGCCEDRDVVQKIYSFSEMFEWPKWMSNVILTAYECGYHHISDGISHPFGWQYGAQFLHLKKSHIGVGHDLLYYLSKEEKERLGFPTTKVGADKWFRDALEESGVVGVRAEIAYKVLILVGFFAYADHALRRRTGSGYGTIDYVYLMVEEL